jgi:glucose/mannose transport system substrate-binding protein
VPNTDFDDCGKKGIADLAEANKTGTLFGSFVHGHANPASVKNAMYDVITRHFNGEIDSEAAVKELVAAIETAKQ